MAADDQRSIALHLNLDAEEELARGAAFGRARSAATLDAMQRAAARLAPLLPAHVVPCVPSLLGANAPPRASRQPENDRAVTRALCWCPTPGALRDLRAAGLEPVASLALALGRDDGALASRSASAFPSVDALARANDRATFALVSPLVTALGTSAVARTLEAAEAHLAAGSSAGDWILRRGLSAAGRGARRVRGGALAAGDTEWLRASLALGPVTLDPRVALVLELALHGWVSPDGATALGEVCVQRVDAHGAWCATERVSDSGVSSREVPSDALRAAAARVAATLRGLGYHGPFGIDAYTWRDAEGTIHLRAPSEVNARFSMGWWTGMMSEPGQDVRWNARS